MSLKQITTDPLILYLDKNKNLIRQAKVNIWLALIAIIATLGTLAAAELFWWSCLACG